MTNPRSRRRPTFAASIDPTAKRPNAKCDPYGQGGTPMDAANARALLSTVHCDWRIVSANGASINIYEGAGIGNESTCLTMQGSKAGDNDKETESGDDGDGAPRYLVREFRHPDLGSGGRFGAVVAAVSEIQAHYPRRIVTERQVVKKSWVVSTTVLCQTQVLGGLSINDFHLAMVRWTECLFWGPARLCYSVRTPLFLRHGDLTLVFSTFFPSFLFGVQMIDVEVDRPEVRKLLLPTR
jgi:hypothetical protein